MGRNRLRPDKGKSGSWAAAVQKKMKSRTEVRPLHGQPRRKMLGGKSFQLTVFSGGEVNGAQWIAPRQRKKRQLRCRTPKKRRAGLKSGRYTGNELAVVRSKLLVEEREAKT